jgi:hypothetical protein
MQYEKLIEFKRQNGHCVVPRSYDKDKSLGEWVNTQRKYHNGVDQLRQLRPDRQELLEEIGFAWRADVNHKFNVKLWQQQYEKLTEFKRKNGHCMVPKGYEQDKSLKLWVKNQRARHSHNKMLPDRKKLLDELEFEFVWNPDTLAACSSTVDERGARHSISVGRSCFSLSVGRSNAAFEETKQARGPARNRFERPSPNRKRPSECLAESEQVAASRTSQRGKATGCCSSSLEKAAGGRDEEDSSGCALLASYPVQEVVSEEAARTPDIIPSGWTRVKLEPDC